MTSSLNAPDVRDVTVWIYGLVDPETGLVRYVGRSCLPFTRLCNHESFGNDGVRYWFATLRERGFRPAVVILHEVKPGEDSAAWESHYIKHFCEHGEPLNILMPSTKVVVPRKAAVPASRTWDCAIPENDTPGRRKLIAWATERFSSGAQLKTTKVLGCSQATMSYIFRGIQRPSQIVSVIKAITGIPESDWLTDEERSRIALATSSSPNLE